MMGRELINAIWMVICQVGNFADAILTFYAISKGVEEANPIMAWALSVSPAFFVLLKFMVFAVAIEFIAEKMPGLLKWVAILWLSVIAWHINFVFII